MRGNADDVGPEVTSEYDVLLCDCTVGIRTQAISPGGK